MKNEIFVSSLLSTQETIPFSRLMDIGIATDQDPRRRIVEVQIVFDPNRSQNLNMVIIASHVALSKIREEDIPWGDKHEIEFEDLSFAEQLGRRFVSLARVKLLGDNKLELWTCNNVLVPNEHPLANAPKEKGKTVLIVPSSEKIPVSKQRPVIVGLNNAELSWYTRVTVVDNPGVLGKVALEFARENVSIKEIRQPKPADHSGATNIACVFWPCARKNVSTALYRLNELKKQVVKTGPVLPALY